MLAESYGDHEEVLFPRGYLIWSHQHRPPIIDRLEWHDTALSSSWTISHSPLLPVCVQHQGVQALAILGSAVSAASRARSVSEIAAWLLAVAADDDQFQDRADTLSGRYVLVRSDSANLGLQADANGLRAIYHTEMAHEPLIGSHAHLVGEAIGAPPNAFARESYHQETNLRAPPGRHTTRQGVRSVIPNTELQMPSREVRRIYPRTDRVERPLEEVLPVVARELRAAHELLVTGDRPVYCSLSAGLDSRFTLAMSRPYLDRLRFFTYDILKLRNDANEHDRSGTAELLEKVEIEHQFVEVDDSPLPPSFRSVLSANRHRAHAPGLALAYRQLFPPNALHVRSNGTAIVKANYLRHGWPDETVTPEYRMFLASAGRCRDLHVLDAFADAWHAGDFGSITTFGHHALDFAYWEDRMGVWLQNIVQESDVAFDTNVPLGSRKILDLLLSVPLPDRRRADSTPPHPALVA